MYRLDPEGSGRTLMVGSTRLIIITVSYQSLVDRVRALKLPVCVLTSVKFAPLVDHFVRDLETLLAGVTGSINEDIAILLSSSTLSVARSVWMGTPASQVQAVGLASPSKPELLLT